MSILPMDDCGSPQHATLELDLAAEKERVARLLGFLRHGATCELQDVRDNPPDDPYCTCGLKEALAETADTALIAAALDALLADTAVPLVPARDFAILTLRALRELVPANELVALAAIGAMLTELEAGPDDLRRSSVELGEFCPHGVLHGGVYPDVGATCAGCFEDYKRLTDPPAVYDGAASEAEALYPSAWAADFVPASAVASEAPCQNTGCGHPADWHGEGGCVKGDCLWVVAQFESSSPAISSTVQT